MNGFNRLNDYAQFIRLYLIPFFLHVNVRAIIQIVELKSPSMCDNRVLYG